MREIFIKTNQPWLDIRVEGVVLDNEKKLGQFTLVFIAGGSHVPAQNITCRFLDAQGSEPPPRQSS
jgi:hypothetical protein